MRFRQLYSFVLIRISKAASNFVVSDAKSQWHRAINQLQSALRDVKKLEEKVNFGTRTGQCSTRELKDLHFQLQSVLAAVSLYEAHLKQTEKAFKENTRAKVETEIDQSGGGGSEETADGEEPSRKAIDQGEVCDREAAGDASSTQPDSSAFLDKK